jgi:hypothetical protein
MEHQAGKTRNYLICRFSRGLCFESLFKKLVVGECGVTVLERHSLWHRNKLRVGFQHGHVTTMRLPTRHSRLVVSMGRGLEAFVHGIV